MCYNKKYGQQQQENKTKLAFLKSTNSILATLVSFAITQIIQTIFSPFTAAAADKFGRNKIIIMVGITRFFILCFFALLVFQNKNFLILAYLASGMTGLTRSFIVPAIQGSVINSVDENQKIPAMLIYSMIMRLTGVIGSLLGGAFSIIFGIEQAILLSGFFFFNASEVVPMPLVITVTDPFSTNLT